MLRQLAIKNLAVIDKLSIDFKSGMTVLTGETGAGKSILLDALGLVLGDRADTNIIRIGAAKTDITAIFSIQNNDYIHRRLQEMELEPDDELFIRRTISQDGRSRAYLNNTPVPVQTLREIGEYLVDIHGQHAHQSLSRPKMQRAILDAAGDYKALLDDVAKTHAAWKHVNQELLHFETMGEDFEARLTLLQYQIDELAQLAIGKTEYATLTAEFKRQSHAQDLMATCQKILTELTETDPAIYSRLSQHQRTIADLCSMDDSLLNISHLLNSAAIQVNEACSELRDYIEQFDMDMTQLTVIENRLDKLHDLARKHKIKPVELPEQLTLLRSQLTQLEGGQEQHEALQKKKVELNAHYIKRAEDLRQKRKDVGRKIALAVTDKMHELGIDGQFDILVESIEDLTPHQYGMDKISFVVSTNRGQPLKPITKIASGGELSRLSLAIQIIDAKDNGAPTMVFDEVDAGVGGGIAETVGRMLRSLAAHRQIFCVTHLAQVASCGHHHLRVAKHTEKDTIFTQVIDLNEQERIDEIARMLAGMKISDESRAHAAQMLE